MNILLGALALLLSSALWLRFILKKDRIEREPLVTFILVGLGGGLMSTVLALFSGVLFSNATGIGFVARRVADRAVGLIIRIPQDKVPVAHSPFLPPRAMSRMRRLQQGLCLGMRTVRRHDISRLPLTSFRL